MRKYKTSIVIRQSVPLCTSSYRSYNVYVFLSVVDAPPILLYSFIEQTLQPGPAVSLKCSASGNPTPQISWALDGFPLPSHGRLVHNYMAPLSVGHHTAPNQLQHETHSSRIISPISSIPLVSVPFSQRPNYGPFKRKLIGM